MSYEDFSARFNIIHVLRLLTDDVGGPIEDLLDDGGNIKVVLRGRGDGGGLLGTFFSISRELLLVSLMSSCFGKDGREVTANAGAGALSLMGIGATMVSEAGL